MNDLEKRIKGFMTMPARLFMGPQNRSQDEDGIDTPMGIVEAQE
jgi:hypothetical protein